MCIIKLSSEHHVTTDFKTKLIQTQINNQLYALDSYSLSLLCSFVTLAREIIHPFVMEYISKP